jgi:methionine-rich copper-binding protein CopC
MDRRRFVPRTEGMEGRMMLSTTSGASALTGIVSPATNQVLPITIQQKLERIDRLPGSLRTLSPDRFLPKDTIAEIQAGLTSMVSLLHPAPSSALRTYNYAMRDIVSRPSLRAQDARVLNNAFISVLNASGAPAEATSQVASALNSLVTQVDTASIQPVFLATNDYAMVLQLALVVGQPMPAPAAPTITKTSGTQVQSRHSVSPLSQPTFTGSYQANSLIQLYNQDTGEVLGTGTPDKTGRYEVKVDTPLAVGTYRLRVRAIDEAGHLGNSSQFFNLTIVPPKTPPTATPAVQVGHTTPQGPITALKS